MGRENHARPGSEILVVVPEGILAIYFATSRRFEAFLVAVQESARDFSGTAVTTLPNLGSFLSSFVILFVFRRVTVLPTRRLLRSRVPRSRQLLDHLAVDFTAILKTRII